MLAAAAFAVVIVITASTPFGVGTQSASGAQTASPLQKQAQRLARTESAALLQLYAAETSLIRARTSLAVLEQRSLVLEREEKLARREATIVHRSLAVSRSRVATLLRNLYVEGEPDPIAVLLGATSLDEAVVGIEGLSRATASNERLVLELARRSAQLGRARARLGSQRQRLDRARSEARAATQRLATAVDGQRRVLASLRRNRSLTAARLAALRSRAQAAGQRSQKITAKAEVTTAKAAATSATPPSEPVAARPLDPGTAPATGTRTLVVDAVAYHLPGNTASGLPVGVGVIAVDPTVIPLGTRVFVPGYGPAVAADVGTAIKGAIIDLWMPSTARARAWGRRTVTITVYG